MLFFQGTAFYYWILLDMLVAEREPTPCYRDAHSVGTLNGHFGGNTGRKKRETTLSPLVRRVFSG